MTRIADSAKFQRGAPVTIIVDGAPLPAFVGETIAGALLASGRRAWRHTRHGQPRGMFCGIGVCFDCLVTVNGAPKVRACLTPVAEGMIVQTQETTP
jgi:predicted molibdopterin-dependent oxidoreductase YjgC